jgi:hypothetical protein
MVAVGTEAQAVTTAGYMTTCHAAGTDAPPDELMPIYEAAADEYELGEKGWSVLAAINRIETNFGENTSDSSAGAKGWMQFMDATWEKYGVDADDDGEKDVDDPDDAIHGAANYLRASGAPGDWYDAIFAYNHADWYVQEVQAQAAEYRGECATGFADLGTAPGEQAVLRSDGTAVPPAGAPARVRRMFAAANEIATRPYVYGGGHGRPRGDYRSYDCSSAVSYVLHAGGLLGSSHTLVSGSLMAWGEPARGDDSSAWVTVWSSDGHVYMQLGGLWFDNYGSRRDNGKPMWSTTRIHSGDGYVARRPRAV